VSVRKAKPAGIACLWQGGPGLSALQPEQGERSGAACRAARRQQHSSWEQGLLKAVYSAGAGAACPFLNCWPGQTAPFLLLCHLLTFVIYWGHIRCQG